MMPKALVFDLDGTLLDTLRDLADSMNAVLAGLGLPQHDPDRYRLFVGEGVELLVSRALPEGRRDAGTVSAGITSLAHEYALRWNATTAPYPGIPGLLDALAARNLPAAVLSNKPDDFTRLTVSRLLPGWDFRFVLGARPGAPRKPHPAGALEIASGLGVAPSRCWYLGDSAIDMRTASAAGMLPVGALWGFRGAEELRQSGARYLLRHPTELVELIDAAGEASDEDGGKIDESA